jgi:hypothetical protein
MIKGTYADYVIQINGVRHFLVEERVLSLQLSEKHLHQTINYGADEGIEWALLTNGKHFDFYKILFSKPIESRKIFSIALTNGNLKHDAELLQYLHKDTMVKKSLKQLWNKCESLNPLNVASIIYSKDVVGVIRKLIKNKYGEKCEDADIVKSLSRIVLKKIHPTLIKPHRSGKVESKVKKVVIMETSPLVISVIENEDKQEAALK